jgi:hypothetical protein
MTKYTKDFIKDPNAKKDYTVDASPWLGTDTISSATWNIPAGLTLEAQSNTTTTMTVWLSGGTIQNDCECTVDFTTAGGRKDRAMIKIQVR